MFASFKKKYFLSDKGISGVKRGVFWTCITNLVTMAGMAFLFQVMDGFVKHLSEGADLPGAVPFAIGLAVFFAALLLSNWQQYYYSYCIYYEECGNQRIEIAERLRKLPLSFFSGGATWRIDRDHHGRRAGHGARLQPCARRAVGRRNLDIHRVRGLAVLLLATVDRRVLEAFPVAFALLFATRKPMKPVFERNRMAKLKVTQGIQETLDCVREIRATNQERHYLAGLNATIDATERECAKGELTNGLLVNTAYAILRLGIATTLYCGCKPDRRRSNRFHGHVCVLADDIAHLRPVRPGACAGQRAVRLRDVGGAHALDHGGAHGLGCDRVRAGGPRTSSSITWRFPMAPAMAGERGSECWPT